MMSSVNHDDFAHLKIPLEYILTATNNFDDGNVVDATGFVNYYVGQLLWSGELINIYAGRLNKERFDGDQQFWTEVSILSSLKHKNLVSFVGFCEDNDEKVIIYQDETRGSLQWHLRDPMVLTWVRRLEISVCIAQALSYIHYDKSRDFSVIHRCICSATILLNDNLEPKLCDFECSMKIKASQRHHSFHTNRLHYVNGYGDPTYIETKSVNHKSDIYSFGIVLFELLCGRESIIADDNNKYLAPLAIAHSRERTLYDIIDPYLWKQMDPQSFNIFAKTAYDCLNEERSQRPNIEDIVTRLEQALSLQLERENAGAVSFISACVEYHVTKNIKRLDPKYKKTGGVTHKSVNHSFGAVLLGALSRTSAVLPDEDLGEGFLSQLKKSFKIFSETADRPYTNQVVKRYEKALRLQSIYENPELPRNAVDGTSSNHQRHSSKMLQWKNLEHLKIGLDDIKMATEKFADKYFIGSGGYGMVYMAQLEHFDSSNSSSIEGVNKCDLPRKRSTVAIKRIYHQEGEQGFISEIETLTTCKHDNIISLLGFCYEGRDHMILVYELASKGSLADYLRSSDKMTNLTWVQRLKMCLDIAHGLNYVHNNTDHGKQRMIHRDIKSDNILLCDNWEAKISDFGFSIIHRAYQDTDTLNTDEIADFGLSKFHPADQVANTIYTNTIAGTYMYLDPEYLKDGRVNSKSDIYSFGVVLLEILTGRVAYFSTKPMYVNLKYKKESETLQAYFATQRDENWMMIELYRFLNQKEDVVFKFLLESFSSYYCGDGAIYVEGIEFRAIDKVKHEEIGNLKEVQQVLKSNFNVDQVQQLPTEEISKIHNNHDELFWLGKLNGKKLLVLSAKAALYKSSNVDLFTSKPSTESRFQEVIELLPQQVFYINCTLRSQMLSLDTEYVCYLVFKISEEYQGLHNPVRVRDLLREENEEAELFIYLITPSQLNIHDFSGVPKQREDGWMEIQLWKFNSTHELKDDSLSINMRFTSLEGMLSGLIVCGLEFRPM